MSYSASLYPFSLSPSLICHLSMPFPSTTITYPSVYLPFQFSLNVFFWSPLSLQSLFYITLSSLSFIFTVSSLSFTFWLTVSHRLSVYPQLLHFCYSAPFCCVCFCHFRCKKYILVYVCLSETYFHFFFLFNVYSLNSLSSCRSSLLSSCLTTISGFISLLPSVSRYWMCWEWSWCNAECGGVSSIFTTDDLFFSPFARLRKAMANQQVVLLITKPLLTSCSKSARFRNL